MEIVLPAEFRTQIVIAFMTSIALTALSIWIAYLVLKWAIRDAIKESGLVEALRRVNTRSPVTDRKEVVLPEIRVD